MIHQHPTPARGFSLIEVLAAMALFALLSVVLFASLRMAMVTWDTGHRRVDQLSVMRDAHRFTRNFIAGAVPISVIEQRKRRVLFDGNEDRVAFIGELPARLGLGGLHWLTFARDKQRLVVHKRPYHPDSSQQDILDPLDESILVDRIQQLRFSYYGQPSRASIRGWRQDWREAEQLPELIRMDLTSDDYKWPSLIIRLHTTTPRFVRAQLQNSANANQAEQ